MGRICCCCLYRDTPPPTFSNDLFTDISSEKQAEEYANAKALHAKLSDLMLKEPDYEFHALRSYFTARVHLKIKETKLRVAKKANARKVKGLDKQSTRAVFRELRQASNVMKGNILTDQYTGRMAGLHSYNVLDSADYIQTKKIEARIKTFDKKLRERQIREV